MLVTLKLEIIFLKYFFYFKKVNELKILIQNM